MPLPLKPGENIYIDHKIKESSYAMPAMQAAHDHYTIGYMVSGDRRWIATDNIRVCHAGDFGIAKPEVYHRNCPISDVPYDRFVIKVRTEVFEPIIEIIGSAQLDMLCRNYLHFTKASQNEIRKCVMKCYPNTNGILTIHNYFFRECFINFSSMYMSITFLMNQITKLYTLKNLMTESRRL